MWLGPDGGSPGCPPGLAAEDPCRLLSGDASAQTAAARGLPSGDHFVYAAHPMVPLRVRPRAEPRAHHRRLASQGACLAIETPRAP